MRQRLNKPVFRDNDSARGMYERVQGLYPDAIVTQSYLRLEKYIPTTGSTVINFDVLTNNGTPSSVERRLNLTDKFVITAISVMIYTPPTRANTADADRSQSTLRTWNNPLVFSGTGEAAQLQTIYNGYLRMIIDSVTYLDSIDTQRFYRAPTAQKGLIQSTGTAGTGTSPNVQGDGYESTHYPFAQLTPTITLNGAGRNEISLNMPSASAVSTASLNNYVVCYLRGFLAQNASQLNK